MALPLTTVFTVLLTHTIVAQSGVRAYAAISVVVTLPTLLGFSSLGVGAAVTDSVARRGTVSSADRMLIFAASLRLLSIAAGAICAAVGLVTLLHAWPNVVGVSGVSGLTAACAAALTLFAAGLPLSLGQNALLGLGKNHVWIICQMLGTLTATIVLALGLVVRYPLWIFAAIPFVGLWISNYYATRRGLHELGLRYWAALRSALGRERGPRIRNMAGPMSIILICGTLANQSDRLVLSHLSTAASVASYAVTATILGAGMSLIQAAAMSLWPIFARQREGGGHDERSFLRIWGIFAAGGLCLGGGCVALGPIVISLITSGQVHGSMGLMVSLAGLLVAQAVWWPVAMLLTDADGLRLQARGTIFTSMLNVALSAILAVMLGAPGPLLGTCAGTVGMLAICGGRARSVLGTSRQLAANSV